MDLDEIFGEAILDRINSKRRTKLEEPTCTFCAGNISCGDEVKFFVKLEEKDGLQVITEATFEAQGCMLSVAGADLICENLKGKTLEELKKLDASVVLDPLGAVVGIRTPCALLGFEAMKRWLK